MALSSGGASENAFLDSPGVWGPARHGVLSWPIERNRHTPNGMPFGYGLRLASQDRCDTLLPAEHNTRKVERGELPPAVRDLGLRSSSEKGSCTPS